MGHDVTVKVITSILLHGRLLCIMADSNSLTLWINGFQRIKVSVMMLRFAS